MTVGMLGAGQMGAALGGDLRAGGARVVTTLAGRSARTARLAEQAGLEILPTLDDVVAQAGVVLVVTPPGAARDAAERLATAAARAEVRPLVADLNAVAPATVRELASTLAAAGLPFVDGSISGPPPSVRPGARIYLSGERAGEVAALPWQAARPILIPGPAGRASAIKMCTASVYKGVNALVAQAIRTAAHHGVLEQVLTDLSGGIGSADAGGMAVVAAKADRFVAEMREIAATQAAAGLTPELFETFARVYADIAETPLATGDPETADRTLPADEIARRLAPG